MSPNDPYQAPQNPPVGQPGAYPAAGQAQPAQAYGAYGPQPAVAPNYPQPQPAGPMYPPMSQPAPYAQGAPQPGQPQKAPANTGNPNSTQNALQIAEIRDGIVIMNDGSFRSVIMVKSINFDLMSPNERDSVEFAYQGFLNSLYFPIQIFVRSQKVDIRPYLERLDKIRQEHDNMLLALLMEDYLGFVENLALQTNIMDKKFYVVVPYFPNTDVQKALAQSKNFFSGLKGLFNPKVQHVTINERDLATAKDELRNRVQAVLDGLRQCSIPGLPLDTQELIELYYDTYNPDTATRQQLKNFDDINVPVVSRGQGNAPQPNLDRTLQ